MSLVIDSPVASVASVIAADYARTNTRVETLYANGKQRQWDATVRIDWSIAVDADNPLGLPDTTIPLYGTPLYERLPERERRELRRQVQGYQMSNFLHGEQAALVCASKIAMQAPEVELKLFAATQAMDEARHVEVLGLLAERIAVAYPMASPLKTLLTDVIGDRRWDVTLLGMQVLIEGLALAVFHRFRAEAANPLARSVFAYLMQDEARHVAFGRIALAQIYPQLTEAERTEREDFVIEAMYLMRDRFLLEEVWSALGLPVKACIAAVLEAPSTRMYRGRVFSRIAPVVREIGLWSPRIQAAFADLGAIELAAQDIDAMLAHDERAAAELDRR
jgi:para-aminobenzoate N-oxygenase AurF